MNMITRSEELLAKADAAARKFQQEKYGEEYGIQSTQVRGLIVALGEMLDNVQAQKLPPADACPFCNGYGYVGEFNDSGGVERVKCRSCRGSGKRILTLPELFGVGSSDPGY